MIVSIHQPNFLPWLGFFDKMDCSDVFVLLDCVQFEKNGWQNRNRIKTARGWNWLTVPVQHKFGTTIAETRVADTVKWQKKHLNSLVTNYSKAPYFNNYIDYYHDMYSKRWIFLAELCNSFIHDFAEKIGIETRMLTVSSPEEWPDDPNQRLVSIVKKFGGDVYLAGAGGRNYIKEKHFKEAGIKVVFQDYSPIEYPQLYSEFIPGLAIVDALFNVGEDTLKIIRKGRRTEL
ncbi:MAG: WbqC family protein [Candidatus Latescibacteria bacterium]|jgi:hypothetical protein|nr:WbqC family protein [Candidatus Latescibacterota bacterium]